MYPKKAAKKCALKKKNFITLADTKLSLTSPALSKNESTKSSFNEDELKINLGDIKNPRYKLKRRLTFNNDIEIEAARSLAFLRRGPRLTLVREVLSDQNSKIE